MSYYVEGELIASVEERLFFDPIRQERSEV